MRGVLLVNLGSPDTPTERDVRRYLTQFLMDPHVLDMPYLLRKAVVSLSILPKRVPESAAAYRSIWTRDGSPLVVISRMVEKRLAQQTGMPIALAMRYQHPSIEQGLQELLARGVTELLLIPLYPQYALSSYETVVREVEKQLVRLRTNIAVKVKTPFFADPLYISALAVRARRQLQWHFDHLLLSFHGLPERHLKKTDPTGKHCLQQADCCDVPSKAHDTCYRAQVRQTAALFAATAGLAKDQWSISFQSRLGKDPWLTPFTDHVLAELAKAGKKRLLIMCPAFVADCLETLEEIGIRGKEIFRAHGGEELRYIPCLNNFPDWIEVLAHWCKEPADERRWKELA